VAGEHPSSSAESRRHFIGYQENAVFGTKLTDPFEVAWRGYDHASRSLNEWFNDEPRQFSMPSLKYLLDGFKAGYPAGGVCQLQRAAIAIRWIGAESRE
jgi:hypothetical protein